MKGRREGGRSGWMTGNFSKAIWGRNSKTLLTLTWPCMCQYVYWNSWFPIYCSARFLLELWLVPFKLFSLRFWFSMFFRSPKKKERELKSLKILAHFNISCRFQSLKQLLWCSRKVGYFQEILLEIRFWTQLFEHHIGSLWTQLLLNLHLLLCAWTNAVLMKQGSHSQGKYQLHPAKSTLTGWW